MSSYSEHSAYYNAFRRGHWATEAPATCPCNGSGWALSEVDTWHECPVHHVAGQRHPEDCFDDEEEGSEEGYDDAPVAPVAPVAEDDIPF